MDLKYGFVQFSDLEIKSGVFNRPEFGQTYAKMPQNVSCFVPSASSNVTSGVIDALLFSQEDEGGFEMFLLRVVSCLGGWLYFLGGEAIEVRNQRGKVTNKNLQG